MENLHIGNLKFPDVLVSPIFESRIFSGPGNMVMGEEAVFPIGVRINPTQIKTLINTSSLTDEQKDSIVGFKIVRGDRSTNSSIVAKGILRNIGKYEREGNEYYFPNYPYNDLRQDPFLLNKSNSFVNLDNQYTSLEGYCRSFNLEGYDNILLNGSKVEYVSCTDGSLKTVFVKFGETITICALGTPIVVEGKVCITSNTYKKYKLTNLGASSITFKVAYPNGFGCDPVSPSITNVCDYCDTTPLDTCCVDSTIVKGKFVLINRTLPAGAGVNITFDSIIKPISTSSGAVEGVNYTITEIASYGLDLCTPTNLKAFDTDDSKYRHVFNSPETSFGTPFLGNVLKLENVKCNVWSWKSSFCTSVKECYVQASYKRSTGRCISKC